MNIHIASKLKILNLNILLSKIQLDKITLLISLFHFYSYYKLHFI
jgi:hypothetical protein